MFKKLKFKLTNWLHDTENRILVLQTMLADNSLAKNPSTFHRVLDDATNLRVSLREALRHVEEMEKKYAENHNDNAAA